MTQEQQVIETMRRLGGYATFRQLNETVDFSSWKTRTPQASVRRIVQNSNQIFNRYQFQFEFLNGKMLKLKPYRHYNAQSTGHE